MGDYTILKVGPTEFNWKYLIPTFLTFLFDKRDFFSRPRRLRPTTGWYEEVGYRTTCGKALQNLDRLGYDLRFFSDVYDQFHDEIEEELKSNLEDEIYEKASGPGRKSNVSKAVRTHMQAYPVQSRLDDLRDFIAFLETILLRKVGKPLSLLVSTAKGKREIKLPDFESGNLADLELLEGYFVGEAVKFPPSIVKTSMLFRETYFISYHEVLSLMYTRLLLQACPSSLKVTLDLHDICFAEDEVKDIAADLKKELTRKVLLYGRAFKHLVDQAEDYRDEFIKSRARLLLRQLTQPGNSNERGNLLEDLLSTIFTHVPGLEVVEKRYTTGDEEIDLLLKNDVSRPFWIALSSPMIFVECKNWKDPVGVKELRDFEIKIQNHHPLVRVGLFIAPNGFSRECESELKRNSRDKYSLVPITREELEKLAVGPHRALDWLERIICSLV